MITPTDLGGDVEMARRVIVYARSLAPCLDSLPDEPRQDAIAILKGALGSAVAITKVRQSAVKTRSTGDWSLSYFSDTELGSVFTGDDRVALASLCGSSNSGGNIPLGSFPEPSRAYRNLWP